MNELREDIRKIIENPSTSLAEYVGAMMVKEVIDSPEWKAAEETDRLEMEALLYGDGRNTPRSVIYAKGVKR